MGGLAGLGGGALGGGPPQSAGTHGTQETSLEDGATVLSGGGSAETPARSERSELSKKMRRAGAKVGLFLLGGVGVRFAATSPIDGGISYTRPTVRRVLCL